jgi:HD-GYP domain-containing protein (c-di-GMP phosphodiesterase class II)
MRRPDKEPLVYDEAMNILQQGRDSHFDARLLDAFARIAPELYAQFAIRHNEAAHQALAQIIDRYFRQDLATLLG